ncbi:hypothetical protein [Ferruginibacter sp.]
MKWVSVNNGTAQESFELWETDTKVADISFSKSTRIARFVSKLSKRLFFFERRGLLTPKAIIKNEYGIKMGKVEETKPGTGKGYVELNDKKYFFVYNENNSGELMLYDEAMQTSLLTCSFNTLSAGFNKTKSLLDTKFPSLLMALCWYVFQPQGVIVTEAVA